MCILEMPISIQIRKHQLFAVPNFPFSTSTYLTHYLYHSLSPYLLLSNCFSALALQYLRSRGVAHLDLKPQNILLSSSTKPVLKIGGTCIH